VRFVRQRPEGPGSGGPDRRSPGGARVSREAHHDAPIGARPREDDHRPSRGRPAGPTGRSPTGRRRQRPDSTPGRAASGSAEARGGSSVVVLLVIIAVLAFSGSDPVDPVDNGTNVADNNGGGVTEPVGPTKTEQRQKLTKQIWKYDKDPVQLEVIYKQAKAKGFSDVMELAATQALKHDEELDWANLQLGKYDLNKVYDQLPKEHEYLYVWQNEEMKRLLEMKEFESRWGSKDDLDKAEVLLRATLKHANKLSDQSYRDIWRIRGNVALHPVYSDFTYSVKSDYPYIVFVQADSASKKAISDDIVNRNVKILARLYSEFHRVFGERFDLPKLEDRPIATERTLKVFTLASEEKFHEYQKKIGQPLPRGVRAYYKPSDQWITLFEGGKFEKQAKEGESSFNINKIFHEGTHQLMHVYTKILMERERNKGKKPEDFKETEWMDRKVHSQLHWFQEGFAELFAASKPSGDTWDLLYLHRNRLQEWKGSRKAKKDEFEFNARVMRRRAQEIGLHPMEAGRLSSLFYAQAWVIAHFLWFGEDGKYREKFLEYMGMELHGNSGYKSWKKVWDKEDDDWSFLEEKVDKHFDELCEKMGVK
jgi:hypothetical protein